MPTISVIIVNFNACNVLRDCLASLPESAPGYALETLVVDNASHDGSVQMVCREFPWATVIANDRNLGFATANNQAMAVATGDFILLLNCDTIVHGDALGRMAGFLAAHPEAGAVSSVLLNGDGSYQQAAYRFNTLWSEFCEHTRLWKLPDRARVIMRLSYPRPHEATLVDWVTGAVLMITRAVYDRVGGLDEDFFMYAEDADWCARIGAAGWKTYLLPEARITHLGGQSSGTMRRELRMAMYDSKYRFLAKNGYARPLWLVRAMAVAGLAAQWGAARAVSLCPPLRERASRAAGVAAYCFRAHLFGRPAEYRELVARRTGKA
ncbi:MAG TPA: glycosyltransferase family 2 protein [Armatimonadota bacterium]|jgi:hypothetical protein